MSFTKQRVEFKTQDGTTLRGNLTLPGVSKAPAVIMITGLTFLKEHGADDTAEAFQKAGFATLQYDHRHWGSSDGLPRQHVNLFQQAEDLSDAISYMAGRSDINGDRIAIWGIGHGGGVVIQTGAYDKRAKAVMVISPFFSGEVDMLRFPPTAYQDAWEERASRIANPGIEHKYVPIFAESMEMAEKSPLDSIIGSPQGFFLWSTFKPLSDAAGTPWENKLTLESLYWQSKFEPTASIHRISPRPIYWVATDAPLLPNYQDQVRAYEKAFEPKQFRGFRSLEESVVGPAHEENLEEQANFLKKWV
ncbi:Alpha/Beta hydrolase protein [Trichoderma sp. SZMC 28013]